MMSVFKGLHWPAGLLAGILLLFAGCGGDDKDVFLVQLAAETVNWETTTNRIVAIGEQRPFTARIVAQSGDEGDWCSFDPLFGDVEAVLEKSGTVGIPLQIHLSQNRSDRDRTATIVVAFSDKSGVVLTLKQLAYSPTAFFDRQWGEQPAYRENSTYIYKTYYTTLTRGGRVRNYSICFDTDKRVSHWVAYPLTTNYVEPSLSRTDAWSYDPNTQLPAIPQSAQSNVVQTFRSAVRGHQCPSADRYSNVATNAMTFYATNIMPQNYDFNGGIWAQLESKIRTVMKLHRQDTIFVVTGTYFDDGRTISDRDGKEVGYPSDCWKVLLRSSDKRAVWESTVDQLYGIGFWFANDDSNTGALRDYTTSIAEIERRTGFTFFRNIPAGAAEAVKAQNRPSDWGL